MWRERRSGWRGVGGRTATLNETPLGQRLGVTPHLKVRGRAGKVNSSWRNTTPWPSALYTACGRALWRGGDAGRHQHGARWTTAPPPTVCRFGRPQRPLQSGRARSAEPSRFGPSVRDCGERSLSANRADSPDRIDRMPMATTRPAGWTHRYRRRIGSEDPDCGEQYTLYAELRSTRHTRCNESGSGHRGAWGDAVGYGRSGRTAVASKNEPPALRHQALVASLTRGPPVPWR